MTLTEKARLIQMDLLSNTLSNLTGALEEAEKLADIYSDVRPTTYKVPIDRMAGFPFETEFTINPFDNLK